MAIGFKFNAESGRSSPCLLCEVCKSEIKEWTKANVEYSDWFGDGTLFRDAIFVHKECSRTNQPRPDCWMDLTDFISWMAWNNNWGEKIVSNQGDVDYVKLPCRRPIL